MCIRKLCGESTHTENCQNIGGEVETEVTDNQGVSASITGDGGEFNADDVTNQGPQAVAPVTLGSTIVPPQRGPLVRSMMLQQQVVDMEKLLLTIG
jgi:hypothetical protein